MKVIFMFICFALIAEVYSAQAERDSVAGGFFAPEVQVTSTIAGKESIADFRSHGSKIETLPIQSDLGTLLIRKGLAVVNVTGAPGSSATVRFRGMSSDHSVFNWNGIPINSISLGTCDVSLVPVFFLDEVMLLRDASVAELPTTGLGMTCNLKDVSPQLQKQGLKVISSMNSLHNAFYGADIRIKVQPVRLNNRRSKVKPAIDESNGLYLRTRFFMEVLRNEFQYPDVYQFGRPLVSQHHNNGNVQALMQDLTLLKGRHETAAHLWLQQRHMNLPSLMGRRNEGTSEQVDETCRVLVKYRFHGDHFLIGFTSAYLDELMQYRDQPQSGGSWLIDSGIRTRVSFNTANIHYVSHRAFTLTGNVSYANQQVFSNQYDLQRASYNPLMGGFGFSWKKDEHRLNADVNQDSRNIHDRPSWSLSYGLQKHFMGIAILPTIAVSHRIRLPDMNELFWNPGGNPFLRPEKGINYKGAMRILNESKRPLSWSMEPALQYAQVRDWIQWIPVNGGLWTPVNYRFVSSLCLEVPFLLKYHTRAIDISFDTRYIHTKAETEIQVNDQSSSSYSMIYTPAHMLSSNMSFSIRKIGVSISHRYTSERFTDEQNTTYRALPEYQITSLFVSYEFKFSDMVFKLSVDADNMFDVRYESVRSYAIPGRVYGVALSAEFISNKNNNHEK